MLLWQCFAFLSVAQVHDNPRGGNPGWFGRADFAIRNANPVSLSAFAAAAAAAIGGGIKLSYDYFAKEVEVSFEDKVAAPTCKPRTVSHIDHVCTVEIPADWNTCALPPPARVYPTSLESPAELLAITICIVPQTTDILRIPRPRRTPFLTPSDVFQRYEDAIAAFEPSATGTETMSSKSTTPTTPAPKPSMQSFVDLILAAVLAIAVGLLVIACCLVWLLAAAPSPEDVYMYTLRLASSFETKAQHSTSSSEVSSARWGYIIHPRLMEYTVVVASVGAREYWNIVYTPNIAFLKFAERYMPRSPSHFFESTLVLLRAVFAAAIGRGIVVRQFLADLARLLVLGASPGRILDVLIRVARMPMFCPTKGMIIANIRRVKQNKGAQMDIEKLCARIHREQASALIAEEQERIRVAQKQEIARIAQEQKLARIAEEMERSRIAEEQGRKQEQEQRKQERERERSEASRRQQSNAQPKRNGGGAPRTKEVSSHEEQRRAQRNRMFKNQEAQRHPEDHEPVGPRPRPTMQVDKAAAGRMLRQFLPRS